VTREPRPGAPPADDSPARGVRVGRRAAVALAAVVVAGVVIGGVLLASRDAPPPLDRAEAGTIASGVVEKAVEDLRAEPALSAVAYQQILPSIVAIETRRAASNGRGDGLGTGVIVHPSGTILTAFHTVAGAKNVRVTFVDGTKSQAEVTGSDPDNDTAVLTPARLPEVVVPAVLGGGVRVGDEAYAVGHPFGLVDSISAGVVSALGRTAKANNGRRLRGLIQFDAAVNPGNSGGPLLNRAGQVVGIVTSLVNPSRSGNFIGIGFAVPIGTAGGAANAPAK
jgi:S1-C subfamily serine protease